ncbi:MAG: hypothetical protein KDB23_02460 [Planctomycetales bacterium]|nr:hypothetical protein [Planctomycetales bacterium]
MNQPQTPFHVECLSDQTVVIAGKTFAPSEPIADRLFAAEELQGWRVERTAGERNIRFTSSDQRTVFVLDVVAVKWRNDSVESPTASVDTQPSHTACTIAETDARCDASLAWIPLPIDSFGRYELGKYVVLHDNGDLILRDKVYRKHEPVDEGELTIRASRPAGYSQVLALHFDVPGLNEANSLRSQRYVFWHLFGAWHRGVKSQSQRPTNARLRLIAAVVYDALSDPLVAAAVVAIGVFIATLFVLVI